MIGVKGEAWKYDTTLVICSGKGPVICRLSTVLPSGMSWWYTAKSMYAPEMYCSGCLAKSRMPKCVGIAPTIQDRRQLVRRQRGSPVFWRGPIGEAPTEVLFKSGFVQVVEAAVAHGPFLKRASQTTLGQSDRRDELGFVDHDQSAFLSCSRMSIPTRRLHASITRPNRGPGFPSPIGVLLMRVHGARQ